MCRQVALLDYASSTLGAIARLLVMGIALVAARQAAVAADQSELRYFVAEHKCAIVERLMLLQARRRTRDRFIIIQVEPGGQHYVQCLFHDGQPRQNRMLCEASSGYFGPKIAQNSSFQLSQEALATLAELGFDTGSTTGNYRQEITYTSVKDFDRIATMLLSALYSAYGGRLDKKVTITAPLARVNPRYSLCHPVG